VVVGNPPYITVKDRVLNQAYRERYATCKGTYALTVPFMERFFGLAKPGYDGQPAGWIGQITSNSFMKREFGSKLIEEFLVGKDLRLVADTSGAYIPGHGTPTVILVGRNQRPVGATVRAVLGVRGEPGRPADAAKGIVWRSIVEHVDEPSWDDGWITIADLERRSLARHPWSLSGGGAAAALASVQKAGKSRLGDRVSSIGRTTATGEDDAFFTTTARAQAIGLTMHTRGIAVGEAVRDFSIATDQVVWWPYEDAAAKVPAPETGALPRLLWGCRTMLRSRVIFRLDMQARGRPWYDHLECYSSKLGVPLGLTFAFVATHNNFALDRAGLLFKQSSLRR
jgi:hypothetical protein